MRKAALDRVYELARQDKRVIFVGSDLGHGTLKSMREELPGQFVMEGIAEQYLVGFAAGLAKEGYIPFVNTIANFFTRRAFEQIAMDAALHALPIRFLATGGGMVYAPLGPTHTAIDDLALMWCVPGMKVYCPSDANEMIEVIDISVKALEGPSYIRFGKGDEPELNFSNPSSMVKKIGNPRAKILFLTTGILIHEVIKLVDQLPAKGGDCIGAIHFLQIDNIEFRTFREEFSSASIVYVIEEHIPYGGLFSRILHVIQKTGEPIWKLRHRSLAHNYPHNYGSQRDHLKSCGLDYESLLSEIGEEVV